MLLTLIYFTAQQFSNIVPYFAMFISLAGVMISYKSVSLGIKNHKTEIEGKAELARLDNIEKMASKLYVKDEVTKVEVTALNIEKDLKDLKADNIREHNDIRKDVSQKLDIIIKLVS